MSGESRSVPRLVPAAVLFLLAPFIAEASIGTVFVPSGGFAFLTLAPIYGGGAILIREIVVRRGGGFGAVALLGLAYAVVEEGLALGSLFSPTIYQAIGPRWGAEIAGLNGVYTLFQLINHALFSITVPIALVELCFPSRRRRPWLKTPGLVLIAAVFLIGFGLVRLATIFTFDPGFAIPPVWIVVSLVIIAGCLTAAVVRRPRAPGAVTGPGRTPRPAALLATCMIVVGVALGILGLPAHGGAFAQSGLLPVLAMIIAAAAMIIGIVLVRRWSRRSDFDDRHRFALAAGSLLAHQLVLGLIHPTTTTARIGVAIVLAVIILLLILLWRMILNARAARVS